MSHIIEGLQLGIERLPADAKGSPTSRADRHCPLLTPGSLPVGGDDGEPVGCQHLLVRRAAAAQRDRMLGTGADAQAAIATGVRVRYGGDLHAMDAQLDPVRQG
jgi:hypothetical protein